MTFDPAERDVLGKGLRARVEAVVGEGAVVRSYAPALHMAYADKHWERVEEMDVAMHAHHMLSVPLLP